MDFKNFNTEDLPAILKNYNQALDDKRDVIKVESDCCSKYKDKILPSIEKALQVLRDKSHYDKEGLLIMNMLREHYIKVFKKHRNKLRNQKQSLKFLKAEVVKLNEEIEKRKQSKKVTRRTKI